MVLEATRTSRLADYLIQAGKLKAADLERTRQLADENPQSLGLLLTRVGLASDRDVASAYAEILRRPLLSNDDIPLVPVPGLDYKESFLREAKMLPLGIEDDVIRLATADPENAFALQAISLVAGKPVDYSIGTVSQIDGALDQWFGNGEEDGEPVVSDADHAPEDLDAIDRLRDLASEAPIIRLVNSLIQRAVEMRASDIHFEPFDGQLRVRYRVDGVLAAVDSPPPTSTAAIISRIKLMACMNIAERRLPQDGRVQIRVQGSVIDLRISTIPTVGGESVVLRILDQDRVSLDLEALGFENSAAGAIRRLIEMPHGIVLVTGPTGSGKSTTLYTLLQLLNGIERKILTIEDPVEYQLAGINQIQVKPQIGLDFPRALRSIVRQDPDVIMIGEMRDLETARIAVQSALTGHLVFSTLHTNDAGSSVTRLLDMGVEDYLVTSSVNGIVAQRLVRKLCTACRRGYRAPRSVVERLRLDEITRECWGEESPTLYRATGCSECKHTGYLGRTVIAEVLLLTDEIRRVILSRADGKAIERAATSEGMETMQVAGLRKAVAGITTIEEVTRMTQA
jgi:general secretion pathway protein E